MVDHGLAADDEVAHAVPVEEADELADVGRQVFAGHGLRLRRFEPATASRTSGQPVP